MTDGGGNAPGGAGDDGRLEAVEIKVAHLERAVQDLSDVLYRQQRELDALLELVRELSRQLESPPASGRPARPEDDVPPHY